MYGHIHKLAEAEQKGIEAAGGKADIYQLVEPSFLATSRPVSWMGDRLSSFPAQFQAGTDVRSIAE